MVAHADDRRVVVALAIIAPLAVLVVLTRTLRLPGVARRMRSLAAPLVLR